MFLHVAWGTLLLTTRLNVVAFGLANVATLSKLNAVVQFKGLDFTFFVRQQALALQI